MRDTLFRMVEKVPDKCKKLREKLWVFASTLIDYSQSDNKELTMGVIDTHR